MKNEGLASAVQFLTNHNLTVATLITDRHTQVPTYLFKKYLKNEHYYNVWHDSKGKLIIQYSSHLSS